jgi:hypothetical protein
MMPSQTVRPPRVVELPGINATIAKLSDTDFRNVIDADIRGKLPDGSPTPETWKQQLRSAECAPRWYETLSSMRLDIEGQLAAKREEARLATIRFKRQIARAPTGRDRSRAEDELDKRNESDASWRSGALRVKSGLEKKIVEARRVLRDLGDPVVTERTAGERNRALARAAFLEDAIAHHKAEFPLEDEPSEADLELWNTLVKH